jgi:hypothetical protein
MINIDAIAVIIAFSISAKIIIWLEEKDEQKG